MSSDKSTGANAKPRRKKLSLSKETLKDLRDDRGGAKVAGGNVMNCYSKTFAGSGCSF